MGEDTRRWTLRDAAGTVRSANIPTDLLAQWASQGAVLPGFEISADGETWAPAETLPELRMTWYVAIPGKPSYGPLTKAAAERLLAEGHFPRGAHFAEGPAEEPACAELPLPPPPQPPEANRQELEETRQRLVLLERELRLKDRRIEELRREAEARQDELTGATIAESPAALAAELQALRLERDHLREAAQEAAEAADARERALRQRIETLESARAATPRPEANDADEALFAVLTREAETLRAWQEEEDRLAEALRDLSRRRAAAFADRLAEIRRLTGETPADMLANALRGKPRDVPSVLVRRDGEARVAALEKALREGRERETELQKRLVALEGRERELRSQLGQAERQTLDSLSLDEKLRETAQALERERAAREREHQDYERVQAQLIRRIEELERALPIGAAPNESDGGDAAAPAPAARGTFGWLRKR